MIVIISLYVNIALFAIFLREKEREGERPKDRGRHIVAYNVKHRVLQFHSRPLLMQNIPRADLFVPLQLMYAGT